MASEIFRTRCYWSVLACHHAGGATALAEAGAPPELIKVAGCWSSQAFEHYIRKNPIILHAFILARTYRYDISIH